MQQELTELLSKADVLSIKQAARVVVEARENHFLASTGIPDYAGRSYAWRQWYGNILSEVTQDHDVKAKLTARMRFHVGNVLRETLTDEQLQDAGLKKIAPKQRSNEDYYRRSGLYRLMQSNKPLTSEEVDDLIGAVADIMERLRHETLTDNQREWLDDLML